MMKKTASKSKPEVKYESLDVTIDAEDEHVPLPIRPKSNNQRSNQYSKAHSVMVRHPKSVTKTEGTILAVKYNDALPVDIECPLLSSHKVMQEPDGSFYNAMLNQTNIASNNNKYYILQMLEHRNSDDLAVWFRWGRVGRIAGTMLKKYKMNDEGKLDALNDFSKKFFDKTRNEWPERADFQKVNGKYDLVEQDFGEDIKTENIAEDTKIKTEPCELDMEVQSLISMICDVSMMESYAKELKFDVERAPLGKLTDKQVQHGLTILKQIENVLLKKSSGRLENLCSQYYTRIPHDFGMRRPPMLRELSQVEEEAELLESLRQITIAINVRNTGDQHIHPTTKAFQNLNCALDVVIGDDFKYVQKLLIEGHGKTHTNYTLKLDTLYKLQREGEGDTFNSKIGNNELLWHGSRSTNFAGIIKNGLKIAPAEAPVTGYMFGKGVYFADCVSKSANYCHATNSNPHGLLLLCKVALGKSKDIFNADDSLPKSLGKYDSIKALGKNIPSAEGTLEGTAVACGNHVQFEKAELCSLLYNEYVVYDTSQIEILYIAKVKFEYDDDLW